MGEGAALIEIRDLVRTFGGVRALDGVSIAVAAGERRAVIGPNGAGKTTLINVITGEIPPTAGVVRIAGEDVTMLRPWQRARKGLARMYQRNELFPPLAARDNVALALAVKAGPYRPLERVPSTQPRAADALLERHPAAFADPFEACAAPAGNARAKEQAKAVATAPAAPEISRTGDRSSSLRQLSYTSAAMRNR